VVILVDQSPDDGFPAGGSQVARSHVPGGLCLDVWGPLPPGLMRPVAVLLCHPRPLAAEDRAMKAPAEPGNERLTAPTALPGSPPNSVKRRTAWIGALPPGSTTTNGWRDQPVRGRAFVRPARGHRAPEDRKRRAEAPRSGAVRKLAGAGLWREQGHGAASRSAPEGWRALSSPCRTAGRM